MTFENPFSVNYPLYPYNAFLRIEHWRGFGCASLCHVGDKDTRFILKKPACELGLNTRR
jgi:hypothetical protein